MEPVQQRAANAQNYLDANTPVPPVVSLALARLPELQSSHQTMFKKVEAATAPGYFDGILMSTGLKAIPETGAVPFKIFVNMSTQEMVSHKESLEFFTADELKELPLDKLALLAPYLTPSHFRNLAILINNHMSLKLFQELPLQSQLTYFRLIKQSDSEDKKITVAEAKDTILQTFTSYLKMNPTTTFSSQDMEVINTMIYLNLIDELIFSQRFEMPRQIWDILFNIMVHENIEFKSYKLIQAMPLDLLNKWIVTISPDQSESIIPYLPQIEQRLRKVSGEAIKYANIINYLHFANQNYRQGKSFLWQDTQFSKIKIAPPRLSNETNLAIDDYLTKRRATLERIDENLNLHERIFLESLNTQIAGSKILDIDKGYYDQFQERPLTLFVSLIEKLKHLSSDEGIDLQMPSEHQFEWAVDNLNRILETLGPSHFEKKQAFDTFVLQFRILNQFAFLEPNKWGKLISNREFWNLLKAKGHHLKITELDLNYKQLKYIPPEIYELTNLKILRLGENEIKYLNPKIKQLKNLEILGLFKNELTTIPFEITRFNLRELTISGNKDLIVPQEFFRIYCLEHLNVSGCKQIEIPTEINLPNLRSLDVGGCGITEFPAPFFNLTNLEYFDLSNNQIITIPSGIEKMKKLSVLNLNRNHFQDFPEALLNVRSINVLELAGNQLKRLPNLSMTNISRLIVPNNEISELAQLPSDLATLEIQYNHLKHLPTVLTQTTIPLNVYITGNGIPADETHTNPLLRIFGLDKQIYTQKLG